MLAKDMSVYTVSARIAGARVLLRRSGWCARGAPEAAELATLAVELVEWWVCGAWVWAFGELL